MALVSLILFPSYFLPSTFRIIWGAWCVLIYMNLERHWVAIVYLEDFIDFWKHFLLPKLFLFFTELKTGHHSIGSSRFFMEKATSYIIIGSHMSYQVYQCLGDSSQTSPGDIKQLEGRWERGSTWGRRGNTRSQERVLKGEIENK